jgi:hypothetical protein
MKDPAKDPWYYGIIEGILWIVPVLGMLAILFVPNFKKKNPIVWWTSLAITICFCLWLVYILLD